MLGWFKRSKGAGAADAPDGARRGFFRAGAGAVVGGAALVASGGAQARETDAPADPGGTGYRETDHVKRYYQSARM